MGQLENWDFRDPVLNAAFQLINRQKSALNCGIISLDRDTKEAVFHGQNGPAVKTSLTNCSCSDFNFIGTGQRKKFSPCIHIYRLAMELGLMQAKYFKNIQKTWQERTTDELAKIHEMERDPAQWGSWSKEVHKKSGQKERQHRAYEIFEWKDFEIEDNGTIKISGYPVILESCACADFEERKAPCKHIYCLALIKGYHLQVMLEDYKRRFGRSLSPLVGIKADLKDGDLKITLKDYTKGQ
jgi:predicted nucleic acid-binding Zn finger protein